MGVKMKKTKVSKQKCLSCNTTNQNKSFHKNTSNQGRSMVEMLGVLAIIGVLSVFSIQGFSLAMRRHRANEIINVANKYALTVYAICHSRLLLNPAQYKGIDGILGLNSCLSNMITASDSGFQLPPKVSSISTITAGVHKNSLDLISIKVSFEASATQENRPLCEAVVGAGDLITKEAQPNSPLASDCLAVAPQEAYAIIPIYQN